MKKLLAVVTTCACLLAGCSDKPAATQTGQGVAKSSDKPADPEHPQPKAEFQDAQKQKQYETLFNEYLKKFAPPETGSFIWLTLTDGGLVLGLVERITVTPDESAIFIKTGGNAAKLPDNYLVEESRARVFLADFARYYALARVKGAPGDAGSPLAKPITRYALYDGMKPRLGPGTQFACEETTNFALGSPLTICGESRDWVEVQSPASGRHFWIRRFETYDLDELNLESRQADIEVLKKSGIAEQIDAAENILLAEPGMWVAMTTEARQGTARAVAAYCAATQKKKILFLNVMDAKTKSKLGKYSGANGWEETPQ